MVDLIRNPIVTPILRAGAVGPEGYFQGKALRRQDTIGDMQLQNLKRIERAKVNFAKNKDFWDSVGSAPPEMVGQDDTNPIQDFTPKDGPKGSQGRPLGFETDQIIHDAGQFDVFDIGTGTPGINQKVQVSTTPLDPLTFTEIDTYTITDVQKSQSFQLSNKIQKDRIGQLQKLFGTISKDWMSNPNTELEKILVEANKLNLDPAAVMAVYAIESNFGKVKSTSAKDGRGSLQVTTKTAIDLLNWFADTKNQKQFNISPEEIEYARKIGLKAKIWGGQRKGNVKALSDDDITKLGLLRLKYNEIVGVPKNLWGAAYQGNAETVRDRGTPMANWDGKITNSDYNKMYTNIYNAIQQPGVIHNTWITNLQPWGGAGSSGFIKGIKTIPVPQTAQTYVPIPPSEGMTADSAKRIADLNAAFAKQAGLPPPPAGVQPPSGPAGSGTAAGAPAGANTTQIDASAKTAKGGSTATESGTAIGSQADISGTSEETKKAISAIEQFGGLKSSKDIKPPSIAQYKDKPAAIGRDIAELMKQRTRAYELSQIARFSGDITGALTAVGSIQELDARLYHAHGMQGIRDLEYGDTLRASRVWSDFLSAGTDPNRIQIRIRRDGNYNVYDNGRIIHEGVSLDSLSKRAQLVFDQGYRDKLTAAEANMASQMFENQLKILLKEKEIMATMVKDITVERQKGRNKLLEEKLKAKLGKDDIKVTATGTGTVIITQGGKAYIYDPNTGVLEEGPFAGMSVPNKAVEIPMIGTNNIDAWKIAFGQGQN
tara:strand:+ start:8271 stop:10580 length:2310 start_codon:yes stop_codon:yes gene_type:complete